MRNHNIGETEKAILQKHGIETAKPIKELLREIKDLCMTDNYGDFDYNEDNSDEDSDEDGDANDDNDDDNDDNNNDENEVDIDDHNNKCAYHEDDNKLNANSNNNNNNSCGANADNMGSHRNNELHYPKFAKDERR